MKLKSKSIALWLGTTAAAAFIAGAASASSMTYTFDNSLSNNDATNASVGSQFSVEVSDLGYNAGSGANQVAFTFRNAADGVQSSITRVYFEDGALLGLAQVVDGPGVDFNQPGDNPFPGPNNVPGGENAPDQPFETTVDFLAKAAPEVEPNGVGNGEWVTVIFDLKPGKDYDSIIASIEAGLAGDFSGDSLRIAIHVMGFENGGSESFILGDPGGGTVIPLPAPLAMGLVGLVGVAALRTRKSLSKN